MAVIQHCTRQLGPWSCCFVCRVVGVLLSMAHALSAQFKALALCKMALGFAEEGFMNPT